MPSILRGELPKVVDWSDETLHRWLRAYFIRADREKVGECLSVLLLSNVLYGTPVYHINGTDPAAWSLKIDRQVVWCDSDGKRLFSKEAASSSAARCRSATAEEIAA